MSNLSLPFDPAHDSAESRIDARDRDGRERAVDPRFNVALEASAGTGKTRVLVERYVNLLRAGVDPTNILAITFTRKAASEMRDRIMATLKVGSLRDPTSQHWLVGPHSRTDLAARGEITPARLWRELRDRTADVTISTIDAFCLSLLREFPLEADLDPGFAIADETEVPRLIDESLDRALRICRAAAREDEDVALVFAQLGDRRARAGLAALLNRRIVAPQVLSKFLANGPAGLDVGTASRRGAAALVAALESMRGGLDRFLETGPLEPAFLVLRRDLQRLKDGVDGAGDEIPSLDPAMVQTTFTRTREHFLTQEGEPRTKSPYALGKFASRVDWEVHRDLVVEHAGHIRGVLAAYRRDLNVLVSRGIWRMFRIAEAQYRHTLDAHAVLDFSDLLLRALGLLRQMEEFSQSRYRLESRYHHVLVDEFQDTSRAQWELVSLLIQSWGEGLGLPHAGPLQPSVFIVGDPKQSIYGFRDADVSVLREAAQHLDALRAEGPVRRSISRSFRSVPPLLAFVNDVCHDIGKMPERRDAFRYEEEDRFPLANPGHAAVNPSAALGLVLGETPEACAEAAAAEIARLLAAGTTVRDRETGVPRPVRPADIAILFRTRESHREFEAALAARGVRTYVYKGLGFFDADEIKDVLALLWYLADPLSDLRAAAFLRSRFVRLSDEALRLLAPGLADALLARLPPEIMGALHPEDARALDEARAATQTWRGLVDRMPPGELLDVILSESAYAFELRGARFHQARENLKKIRGLVRRMQNRGYATLGRIAAHLDRLAVGDESNAAIDALDAVSLMTVHAAKGLEFPVVFVVNLARGTGNRRNPIRIAADSSGTSVSVAVGDFQSDADEDARAKDIEETKRLLYVALTRGRDRLYLGSVLKEGRVQPGRGSLAEVLPASLLDQMTAVTEDEGVVHWRASSGAVHEFRVAPADAPATQASPLPAAAAPAGGDFRPLTDAAVQRVAVADVLGRGFTPRQGSEGRDSDRLVGTLVHRLLQRYGFEVDEADIHTAAGLLRQDEVTGDGDAATVDEAMASYRAICQRADLRALYSAGERFHEVPFTMRSEGRLLRGTIDCLIRTEPDRITLLEFKTGRSRDDHRLQLDIYRHAAARLFPGAAIDAMLVYAEEATPL